MDDDLKFFMHTCSNSHVQPIIRHGRNITAATRQALVCKKNEYDGAISKILYQPPQYNVTVQQIFRRYGKHYLDDKNSDNLKKRIIAEVVRNLVYCRTPAMGTHYQSCTVKLRSRFLIRVLSIIAIFALVWIPLSGAVNVSARS